MKGHPRLDPCVLSERFRMASEGTPKIGHLGLYLHFRNDQRCLAETFAGMTLPNY